MTEMTGTCRYCGQAQIVMADSQAEADLTATESCSCDNVIKKIKQFGENVEKVCGQEATSFGMEQLTEEVIDIIKDCGTACLRGLVDSASLRVTDSTISIKLTKDGVAISRKKVSSVKLET